MKSIIFIMSLLFVSNAMSYSFTNDFNKGYYWERFPIKFHIASNGSVDGKQLKEVVEKAVDAWESEVGEDLFEISDEILSEDNGENVIRFSDDFGEETGYNPYSTLAITTRYSSDAKINRAVIIINDTFLSLRKNLDNTLYRTILHELGHSIGIGHSEEEAIMYKTLVSEDNLQFDDIEAAKEVYNLSVDRQINNYSAVSPFEENDENAVASCGTVDLSGGDNSGTSNFLSLLIGLMLFLAFPSIAKLSPR